MVCVASFITMSCKTNSTTAAKGGYEAQGLDVIHAKPMLEGQGTHALPKAVIYKTNKPLNNHVAVVLGPDRQRLITFPAPSDVSTFSEPLPLAQGWLLDRRGTIGPGTAFLTYTYVDYAALPQAPAPNEIMAAIMPDAFVTQAVRLDITPWQAANDTAAVNRLIYQGLPNCTTIVP